MLASMRFTTVVQRTGGEASASSVEGVDVFFSWIPFNDVRTYRRSTASVRDAQPRPVVRLRAVDVGRRARPRVPPRAAPRPELEPQR